MEIAGRKLSQGEISRWLKEVKTFIEAGGVLPGLEQHSMKPTTMDPQRMELGNREVQRTPRQRERRTSD
jgi:hypothetical protein